MENTIENNLDEFWYNDPKILWKFDRFIEFFPNPSLSLAEKLNALVRLSFYICIILMVFYGNYLYLYIPIVVLAFTFLIYKNYNPGKKENFFDCWVSNPPYIPISDQLEMADNVLKFEPHMALFVENNDPLIFYRKISENAHLYLKSGGKLFFEIHERFATETIAVLENLGFVNIQLRKDLQGRDRMLQGQKP